MIQLGRDGRTALERVAEAINAERDELGGYGTEFVAGYLACVSEDISHLLLACPAPVHVA